MDTLIGLTKKDIPYEAQIIRVADEFEAISAKRQYKTHIGIIDTLNILIENSQPVKPQEGLKMIIKDATVGKIDKKIVKALFKVIADDTENEIVVRSDYLKYVKDEIKRLGNAQNYFEKYNKAKREKDKEYYKQGIEMYLKPNETIENFQTVIQEYKDSYVDRQNTIERLEGELKQIKKLRV